MSLNSIIICSIFPFCALLSLIALVEMFH